MKIKPILSGFSASFLLVSLYVLIMSLVADSSQAWYQYVQIWPWMTALVIGFGVQVGLFVHLRESIKQSAASVTTSGGVSTVSMIACCAHHLSDIIPILGLSAATLFVTKYQFSFLILGIVSNIWGILYMLTIFSKHNMLPAILNKLLKKQKRILLISGIVGFGIVLVTFGVRQ